MVTFRAPPFGRPLPAGLLAAVTWATMTLTPGGVRGQAPTTVYMSSNSDDVNRYTPPGPVSQYAHLPFGTNPAGLAFDTAGNLFVAGGNDVSKITPTGMVSHFADLPVGAGGTGMAIDQSNNLYVANVSIGSISKITPGGTVSTYGTVTSPRGLTFDGIGNLYIVTGQTVAVMGPGGGAASTYAPLTGHVNTYGVAIDSFGYLYVSDLTSAALLKIAPAAGRSATSGRLAPGRRGWPSTTTASSMPRNRRKTRFPPSPRTGPRTPSGPE
jgi:streptogramin lyase